jgi:hypothetical protein
LLTGSSIIFSSKFQVQGDQFCQEEEEKEEEGESKEK